MQCKLVTRNGKDIASHTAFHETDLMQNPVLETHLSLPHRRQGKVRDVYEASTHDGQPGVLLVATDRISAFDVVMPNGIPDKGIVLTQLSNYWFSRIEEQLGDRLSHHLITTEADEIAGLDDDEVEMLRGRVVLGRRCETLPIECIVRGYLAGSGWKSYQQSGEVCGVQLPAGLQQCEQLPEPIFTPSTKAETGHDENISFEQAAALIGTEMAETLRDLSIAIYRMAHDQARRRGIIVSDTKFEFGLPLDADRTKPLLIDEVLTPDSSRFWPADTYEIGRDQDSFDKQYVRNYLEELVDRQQWAKQPPGPELPQAIVMNTRKKYLDAYTRLTGRSLSN